MNATTDAAAEFRTCEQCGEPIRSAAAFCGRCGTAAESGATAAAQIATRLDPEKETDTQPRRAAGLEGPAAAHRRRRWREALLGVIGVLVVAALVLAFTALIAARAEQSSRRAAIATLQNTILTATHRIVALEGQNEVLSKRLAGTQKTLTASEAGVAPLAGRMLKSVFTVVTPNGLGTGWAAWTANGATFLITANHVAQDAITSRTRIVSIRQKNRSWRATITATDAVNDLAIIRVHGTIAPPLWQTPDNSISPLPGDRLLLVGSPYGLEGTVTTGVVSRVTYDQIQTDAAANPGNSGGPAVNADGQVVGVLLSGGGENLNFLVPIQRACVTVRIC